MKFISVCSGIEAASVAWRPLGWSAVAFSEIEPFPCALLAHHYPNTPNWGDMTKFKEWPDVSIDLLCGGTPCQSFSVAGLRKGLDDPRGNLMLTFGAIAAKYRPKWLAWENVPGVLSSDGGRDFASFLGLITGQKITVPEGGWGNSGIISGIDSAYGVAYRVLDAQYFGVAQRRRRVFVVGCLGDWRSAAAVLFERHSLQGHPAPSQQTRQATTRGVEFGLSGGRFTDVNPTLDTRAKDGPIRNQLAGAVAVTGTMKAAAITFQERGHAGGPNLEIGGDLAFALTAPSGGGRAQERNVCVPVAYSFDALASNSMKSSNPHSGCRAVDVASVLDTTQPNPAKNQGGIGILAPAYGIPGNWIGRKPENGGNAVEPMFNVAPCQTKTDQHAVVAHMQVRRLTPRECERLQGFQWRVTPDYPGAWEDAPGQWWSPDYTAIGYRKNIRPEKLEADWLKYLDRGNPKQLTREEAACIAADGPRYKALGNSWAVPNVR
jgi:DNA (cytosine-5)-methyltransferase 1